MAGHLQPPLTQMSRFTVSEYPTTYRELNALSRKRSTMLSYSVVQRFLSRTSNHDPIYRPIRSCSAVHKLFNHPRKTRHCDEQKSTGSDNRTDLSIYTMQMAPSGPSRGGESGLDLVDARRNAELLTTEASSAAEVCRCHLRSASMQPHVLFPSLSVYSSLCLSVYLSTKL